MKLTRKSLLRLAIVALAALVIFYFFLLPCVIWGESMAPTFPKRGFTFCWRGKYWFSAPHRGDVVVIKNSGREYYLKRIVALPGETVEFRRGVLYVNGKAQVEPYLRRACTWELSPRKVELKHYYVVGDNRSMPLEEHRFGQVDARRIVGVPLW